ncbi:hypothetical protein GCM10023079_01800 [Streptomyces chitinivorans]
MEGVLAADTRTLRGPSPIDARARTDCDQGRGVCVRPGDAGREQCGTVAVRGAAGRAGAHPYE